MGLDFVNLALRIEEEFNIYLSDATLAEIRTPNDIASYIHDEYVTKNYSQCSSQIGFYKIRKLLINEFSLKREQIKPSTSLEVLLEKDIRTNWKKLNRLLENKLSPYPLILTKKVSNIIIFISMGIGTFIFYQHFYLDQTSFIKSFFSTLIFTLFTWFIIKGLGQHFLGRIIPSELTDVTHDSTRQAEKRHS